MKKLLFFALLAGIFSSCKKDSGCDTAAPTTVASAAETAYLQNYLNVHSLTATSTHGMFYIIDNPGTGASPNLCSKISVNYVGNIIVGSADGAIFDQTTGIPASISLSSLIQGWQLVLPMLKAGGSVDLYIPPSLGYGAAGEGSSVPPNSYLKFTIDLLSVN